MNPAGTPISHDTGKHQIMVTVPGTKTDISPAMLNPLRYR